MRRTLQLHLGALIVMVIPVLAAAQPPIFGYETPTRCTSLNVVGGISTAESNVGGLVGGAAAWQATPWFGVEAAASWLNRPGTETGFSAAINGHVNLLSRPTFVPFLRGGVGLYHASLAANDSAAPPFYRERLETSASEPGMKRSFTDPALVAGGGVEIFVSRRVSLRPQGEAMFVIYKGDSRVMPAFTLHLAYHFEEHPITPSRK